MSICVREWTGENVADLGMNVWQSMLPDWDQRRSYPLLGHVDPYGDTMFNEMQAGTVLEEMERFALEQPSDERSALAIALRRLVEEHVITSETMRTFHRQLWVIGD